MAETASAPSFADAHTHVHWSVRVREAESDTGTDGAAAATARDDETAIDIEAALQAVEAGRQRNVRTVVVCGTTIADTESLLRLRACVHGCVDVGTDAVATHKTMAAAASGTADAAGEQPVRLLLQFGIHPWYASNIRVRRTGDAADAPTASERAVGDAGGPGTPPSMLLSDAMDALRAQLVAHPDAQVGEIGLDDSPRGLRACDAATQMAVCAAQLRVAAAMHRSVSMHCVRAHEKLIEALLGVAEDERRGLNGVLLHSWASPPTAGQRILDALRPLGVPVVFSFHGPVVVAVVEHFRDTVLRHLEPGPSSARERRDSVPEEQEGGCCEGLGAKPAAPASHRARGSSKGVLSWLAQLPPEHVVFETDAPAQPFDAGCAEYEEWCSAVFGPLDSGRRATNAPGHHPGRVVEVYRAAAIWRCLKRKPTKSKTRAGAPAPPVAERLHVSPALADALAKAAGQWPSPDAVRAELDILCRAATANVMRICG